MGRVVKEPNEHEQRFVYVCFFKLVEKTNKNERIPNKHEQVFVYVRPFKLVDQTNEHEQINKRVYFFMFVCLTNYIVYIRLFMFVNRLNEST